METDECWKNIPNPTSLNVRRQLDRLFEQLPRDSPLASELHTEISQNALLPTLSRFMLRPALTMPITNAFRPLLMDLCARWLDTDEQAWEKLAALGMLIEIHEEIFSILSTFLRRFERGPLCVLLKEKGAQEIDRASLHRVLLAYYRILRATPTLPRNLNWNLECLLRLCALPNLDRGARWLAIRCYSMQSRMTEKIRIRMEQDSLGELYHEDCSVVCGEDILGNLKEVDGWILPILESRRIRDYRENLVDSSNYFEGGGKSDFSLTEAALSPRVANVHGILLLRSHPPTNVSLSSVVTSSSLLTLRRLAVNISLRRPTLLTSTPSSGKTTLIHHLSSLIHPSSPNHVITIHLADTSLDPRSLIGSYVSSTASVGTFEWKDGVLVKAMREGRWIVLKDIDRASNEVLGLISPLAESLDDTKSIGSNAFLSLGNRGTVGAAESFALFATRSIESNDSSDFPALSFLGAQKWREVTMLENSLDDLRLLVDYKFPNIAGAVADGLIDIWLTVKQLRVVSSTRTIGIRDLEKFCARVSQLLGNSSTVRVPRQESGGANLSMITLFPHPSIREEIYSDARDVFFAAGASSKPAFEQRSNIATAVGEKLGLSEDTCEWLLKRRSSAFEIEKDVDGRPCAVRAGRTLLSVKSTRQSDTASARPFSMHKQALRLISQIAACVTAVEPVLLTGETGTGKTSVISHLAFLLNKPLVSLNLSNQTESSDLIGGFRPVSARVSALELQHRFLELFQETFSLKKNEQLLQNLRKAIANAKWKAVVKLWSDTTRTAVAKLKEREDNDHGLHPDQTKDELDSNSPRKRRKLQGEKLKSSVAEWTTFQEDVNLFEVQNILDKNKFSFHFVEGPLVKAIRSGSWVLLDEVNLASPETLECIASLLQGPSSSITLTEQGSLEPVPRHPEFRLFACMNPATDIGKKDLPNNIRARFTEIEVPPPDDDQETLVSVIAHYIGHLAITDKAVISDIAELYTSLKQLAASGKIADGSNHRPHFSMRSLARALTFAVDTIQIFGLRRALWEGFTMAFTMMLDEESAELMLDLARRTLLSNVKNKAHFLTTQPPFPQNVPKDSLVQVGPFWLPSGPVEREEVSDYILTPSVQKKLMDLARIVMTKRYAVLIEGPTSSGKTSAVQYLARSTGHNFVRINNHEHTDIQEYLGSYVSDSKTGKLVFRDGLLVRALRRGDWIVLDELNLAPTDVLEALNRLLDDNRELVVPETQESIRPHPNFMLFATQNPPGVYAGRKVLSRALRNRFLGVHFEDVPPTELEHILSERSCIAPSYAHRIVLVFRELQKRRQISRVFEGKEGFATLRDLFRWADRGAQGYHELAEAGYMLLAERTRREEDKLVVKEVIEMVMNESISEDSLYSMDKLDQAGHYNSGIVWTRSMRRLFILLSAALRHNEPVLLVGETGTGKTSVCQLYATIEKKVLRTVNCHQNTEAADIIGGLRPHRPDALSDQTVIQEAFRILGLADDLGQVDKAHAVQTISQRLQKDISVPYEHDILIHAKRALLTNQGLLTWQDGPLVTSMRRGDVFLLDEISLADDSVLERLNSVLEPGRSIVLAEKGGDASEDFDIIADPEFKFVATMNPGGDFGKKELSPALRNRFTEIWVPSIMDHNELHEIVRHSWEHNELARLTEPMLGFVEWLVTEVEERAMVTLRDILSWVEFCNTLFRANKLSPEALFVEGGEMAFLDGLYSVTQLSGWSVDSLKAFLVRARCRLVELAFPSGMPRSPILDSSVEGGEFRIGSFGLPLGLQPSQLNTFSFKAPTSLRNAFRLLRACQISKPILLEGSPGVGKTSLVTALAEAAAQNLCRINLSEQTDLVDLFGSDLPVDGDASGAFAWRDAEFLRALKEGDWVLLDEMNLASQSVLEGLNAVFDHRATVYIPEINKSYQRHPNFRVFAAQNPLNQGNGRKGLPKSFLNRFTKVYIEELSPNDLILICHHLFQTIETSVLERMISFNGRLQEEVIVRRRFGVVGAPWEFNLRDLIRWASLMTRPDGTNEEPWKYAIAVYGSRFRTTADRRTLMELCMEVFDDTDIARKVRPILINTPEAIICGTSLFRKGLLSSACSVPSLLSPQITRVESALCSLSRRWLVILTGSRSSGKTSFARALASACNRPMQELFLGSSTDTSDLIGSFEQTSLDFKAQRLLDDLLQAVDVAAAQARLNGTDDLYLLLRLKDEAIAAQRTRSLAALQNAVRDCLSSSVFRLVESGLQTVLDAISSLPMEEKHPRPTFEWIDGPLIRSMKQGHWLLLDNANLCSPSVLDRLNSLCEENGFLVLTEKGVDQEIVRPHPGFRLVMTVDPIRGEISRAMRNRGFEIALDSLEIEEADGLLCDAGRLAPHRIYSHSILDLCRRALFLAPAIPKTNDFVSVIREDTISSEIMEVEALYRTLNSSCDIAIALLAFSRATPCNSEGLLRMFGSLDGPRRITIMEQLHLSLQDSTKLRPKLSRSGIENTQYGPLNPFLEFPFVTCRSDGDHECARVSLLIIEACFMASRVELQLRKNASLLGNRDHEHIYNFMEATSLLLRHLVLTDQARNCNALRDTEVALHIAYYARHLDQAISHPHIDFSVLYAISDSILQRLSTTSEQFVRLRELGQVLHDKYALTSGERVGEIWLSFNLQRIPLHLRKLLPLFETTPADVRKRVADLVAVACLKGGDIDDLNGYISWIQRRFSENSAGNNEGTTQKFESEESNQAILISEMNELADIVPHVDTSTISNRVGSLGQKISRATQIPKHVAYKLLLWKMEAGLDILPELINAHLEWHRSFWGDAGSIQKSGPSIACSPIFLQSALAASTVGGGLGDIDLRLTLLNDQIELILSDASQARSRECLMVSFLLRNIELVLRASFPDVGISFPRDAVGIDRRVSVYHILGVLQHSALGPLKPLLPTLEMVANCSSWVDLLPLMGQCWILLSQVLISLYVPSIPVDPLVVRNSRRSFLESQIAWLESQSRVYSLWEYNRSGHRENTLTDILQKRCQRLLEGLDTDQGERNITRQCDSSTLQSFWTEVRGFLQNIASQERLERFMRGSAEAKGDISGQESLLQDAITNFVRRMRHAYGQLEDLILPIELSMMQLRFGLGALRHSTLSTRSISIDSTCKVLSFPSARAKYAVLQSAPDDLLDLGLALPDVLLLRLVATLQTYDKEVTDPGIVAVRNSYERIMSIFDVNRKEKEERGRRAESLYRSKQPTYEITDGDSEEEQIRQLFPIFTDEDGEIVSDSTPDVGQSHIAPSALSARFSKSLLNVHFLLFCKDDTCIRQGYGEIWHSMLLDMVTHQNLEALTSLPCFVDDDSYAFRLRTLLNAKAKIERVDRGKACSFYRDANLPEAKRAADVVKGLRGRLGELILKWPDQLVLQHLRDRCDAILSINMNSSVAKMLGAIERLLIHTEDWEMFADRENSLTAQRQSLVDLIVGWRKLELEGWRSILEVEAREFCTEISDWWYRMYDVTIRGAVTASRDTDGDSPSEYLNSLTLLVEDLVISSPLGQFKDRLKLILSFAALASGLASTERSSRDVLKRVSLILVGIHHYYEQFAENVSSHFREGSTSIEKDVQSLVKLATWRDVNVHALQQSAQRTHRQLYKRIRQFRELLRQPVATRFQIDNDHSDASSDRNDGHIADGVGWRTFVQGSPRAMKFATVLSTGVKRILDPSSTFATETLSHTIITVQSEYAKERPTRDLSPGDRKKWVSSLLARKRRSWNDFLKELKRIGLSPNVKHDITEAHRSTRHLMEQPAVDMYEHTPFWPTLSKINRYFYRCIGLLRALLDCDVDHHSDLSTREIRRGVSSFENAFSFATSARSTISGVIGNWSTINSMYHKLCELDLSQSAGVAASTARDALHNVTLRTREAIDASQELIDSASQLSNLADNASFIGSDALSGIRNWISEGEKILGQLSRLSMITERGCLITEDDYNLIREAVYHLQRLEALLTDMSKQEPRLVRLCVPIRTWLEEALLAVNFQDVIQNSGSVRPDASTNMNIIIDLLLVVGQDLVKADELANEDNTDNRSHLHRQHAIFSRVSRILRADGLVLHLRRLSEDLSGSLPTETSEGLRQILPFIGSYLSFTERYLTGLAAWTKSLLKLTYVSGGLLRNIAANGFCRSPDLEDVGNDQGGALESAEGTGLGQGSGQEDVSNQIEDESQFEGTKGQNDESEDQQTGDENGGAIEVDFDLGGEFEGGDNQDTNSEEEELSSDLDDEFANNVSDGVDEDFWNGEAADDKLESQPSDGGTAVGEKSEVVAKEKESIETEMENERTREEDMRCKDENAMEAFESTPEDEESGSALPERDETQRADSTDEDKAEEASTESAASEIREALDELDTHGVDEEQSDFNQVKEPDLPEPRSSEDAMDAEEDESNEHDEGVWGSKADVHAGSSDGAEKSGFQDQEASGSCERASPELTASPAEPTPIARNDAQEPSSSIPAAQAPDQRNITSTTTDGDHSSSHGTESRQRQVSAEEILPNPHRSLGDALREVRRRLDEIWDTASGQPRETPASEQPAVEYAPDESAVDGMQALGPALGEETAKLSKMNLTEVSEQPNVLPEHRTDHRDQAKTYQQDLLDDGGRQSYQESHEGRDDRMDIDQQFEGDQQSAPLGELSPDGLQLSQGLRVEAELTEWLRSGRPPLDAQRIWQLYDSLTQSLSFSLCEQLRLILEPTRATRLMGDFRTGKRLNMKKIIPYVASNYTKDKIWLRRVRPSQREYQVLIALDDSRSMAESHSIHLAFQTLALVSKALNRLEVGDIAVASFGEGLQIVHGFEDGPFTEQAGTKVLETFKFAQTTTNVRSMLDSSVEVLTQARERRVSSSSSDLWQLEIIISDGICQDHEEIRAILRKAEEERILTVFIIIDAQHNRATQDSTDDTVREQSSIVNMTQALYRTVNGRFELHMQRYLDSFPFEFFVILKDVETLPDVLADTLRQFFERISAS